PGRPHGSADRSEHGTRRGRPSEISRLHAQTERAAGLPRALLAGHNLREAGKESGSESELREIAQRKPESKGRAGSDEAGFLKGRGSSYRALPTAICEPSVTPRSIRIGYGSSASPFHHSFVSGRTLTAKCRCGAFAGALPVEPTYPMTSPRLTLIPSRSPS